ncbi:DUF4236 domain-containing protein [Allopusillimonas soli]|uniref:DUF4236 domain-containing protein n=1 Tax=Allopusillimonas soli TaxID=659016 RepID=A0A853FE67_9BURK|nr:DUF4236 domain-containing protein [Allopusillimonas soli]NYT38189.1 DUF4236 domain-containing protein [Allopusillimonas soli]TEA74061.1 DUF4236 domain-containing protein [Allopusillimonas soli]
MALRFRRSIKLAPGIRMNLSKSGMSWTLGPRGASVGIGKRGARLNTSFIGFSSSQNLHKPPPKQRQSLTRPSTSPTRHVSLICGVADDGLLTFHDQDGTELSESMVELAKKQNREAILGLIQRKCDEINGELDALANIHLDTPPPYSRPRFIPAPYASPAPLPPTPSPPRWWEKLLPKRLAKLEAAHQQAIAHHQRQLEAWEQDKARYEKEQEQRQHFIEHEIYHDISAMERWLEENLQDIAWPRETLISLEIAEQGQHVRLDVDLPELEDMPSKIAAVPARGLKLSVKDLPAAQIRKRYMAHVHGIGFRIVGETFAALPSAHRVTLSGFSQRNDPATGQVRDDYLYSVSVERRDWERIDFAVLEMIDVVESLAQFELRRQMTKTGIFKPIQPI